MSVEPGQVVISLFQVGPDNDMMELARSGHSILIQPKAKLLIKISKLFRCRASFLPLQYRLSLEIFGLDK